MFLKPKLNKFHFFVLGHKPEVPFSPRPFLEYINLNDLDVGVYQKNDYAESRMFHVDLSKYPHEYLGFGTWQWNKKFHWTTPLENLHELIPRLQPNLVLTPSPVRMDLSSIEAVEKYYEPIPQGCAIFREIADHMGVPLDSSDAPRVFCNTFICHRSVYNDFVEVFRREMDWLIEKYGNCENLQFSPPADPRRKPGYLFEMICVHYFATRKDLVVEEITTFK